MSITKSLPSVIHRRGSRTSARFLLVAEGE